MNCGLFTPMEDSGSPFNRGHFCPKNGNQIVIGGMAYTIPSGVCVQSGGLIIQLDDCIIEKTAHQQAAANTLYRAYAFMDGGTMRPNLSTGAHKEDATYGNEVHVDDAGQSLIGMIRTDANGKFAGNAHSQMLLSWFNPCRSPLCFGVSGSGTYSNSFSAVYGARLEYLLWGINSSFLESFDHPNICVDANVRNDVLGAVSYVGIAIDGTQCGKVGSHWHASASTDLTPTLGSADVRAVAPGAGGKSEGYHYADLLIRTSGTGNDGPERMVINDGVLYTSPLRL